MSEQLNSRHPYFLSDRTICRLSRLRDRLEGAMSPGGLTLSAEEVVSVAVCALERLIADEVAFVTDDGDAIEFGVDSGNPFQISLL